MTGLTFRGAVVQNESTKPIRLGRCEVGPDRLVLVSPSRGEFVIERDRTRAVKLDRQRGPFSWRTVVRFDCGSTPFAMKFVPIRSQRFARALRDLNWPVVDQ